MGKLRVVGLSSFTVITAPMEGSCGLVTAAKPVSHRGRAVTRKEWDVLREKERKEEA